MNNDRDKWIGCGCEGWNGMGRCSWHVGVRVGEGARKGSSGYGWGVRGGCRGKDGDE